MGRAKGRPPTALVTREKIADASLEIISEVGYEKLTMARIARRVGVGPSALYNHVSGKEDLLLLIEDALMTRVDDSALDAALAGETDPATALTIWARSYRDVFAEHTPLVEVIARTPISGAPGTVAMYEKVAKLFSRAGVPDARILSHIIMVESFIYGSVFDVHAPQNIFAVPTELASAAPALTRARRAWAEDLGIDLTAPDSQSNPFADDPFALGLDILLGDIWSVN
ncbi:TetR/AcrR family transcriptional regulator [Corynebacterium phoceense]|uniref:TetR/AcrR family transcriptional regulator n=1 Tax=Corynebacterium phoceense TaxID=1686286 RepID=UPI001D765E3A|nr:TetR/AcrR family transcriptional regulator [Corynebacterium phoceense]HJG44036.1 TetR/AcrR family transcriptional regulator [Corynebacterium phoceense]